MVDLQGEHILLWDSRRTLNWPYGPTTVTYILAVGSSKCAILFLPINWQTISQYEKIMHQAKDLLFMDPDSLLCKDRILIKNDFARLHTYHLMCQESWIAEIEAAISHTRHQHRVKEEKSNGITNQIEPCKPTPVDDKGSIRWLWWKKIWYVEAHQ